MKQLNNRNIGSRISKKITNAKKRKVYSFNQLIIHLIIIRKLWIDVETIITKVKH